MRFTDGWMDGRPHQFIAHFTVKFPKICQFHLYCEKWYFVLVRTWCSCKHVNPISRYCKNINAMRYFYNIRLCGVQLSGKLNIQCLSCLWHISSVRYNQMLLSNETSFWETIYLESPVTTTSLCAIYRRY